MNRFLAEWRRGDDRLAGDQVVAFLLTLTLSLGERERRRPRCERSGRIGFSVHVGRRNWFHLDAHGLVRRSGRYGGAVAAVLWRFLTGRDRFRIRRSNRCVPRDRPGPVGR